MVINNVVIVGGGSAGWMTAAALAYKLPELSITLIESPAIGNVGVGESTLGHINAYMLMLGLKDEEWMKECSATYKTSIQFTDFKEKGTVFQYPFGHFNAAKKLPIDLKDIILYKKRDLRDFARFCSINSYMAEQNKMWGDHIPEAGYDPIKHTAYHLDADAFGQYLKKRFCQKVKHIEDKVITHQKDNDGNLEFLTTEKGLVIGGDLFIDCSGFKSLLLEKTMASEWEQFETLPNDSAVTARIPYKNEADKRNKMSCVTDCKALSSGWLWDIPLWSRLGTGYVYSSEFQSKESAEEEFRQETGWDGDVRHIRFRHGLHKDAWIKNVVGVGLAYGFIEPLESTGLMTTHENIMRLLRLLINRQRRINQFDKDKFNELCYDSTKGLSNFVAIHYGLSLRNDTPYWEHVTQNVVYTDPREGEGVEYIGMGMGWFERSTFDIEYDGIYGIDIADQLMTDHLKDLEYLVEQMPSHYEYLKSEIYK